MKSGMELENVGFRSQPLVFVVLAVPAPICNLNREYSRLPSE